MNERVKLIAVVVPTRLAFERTNPRWFKRRLKQAGIDFNKPIEVYHKAEEGKTVYFNTPEYAPGSYEVVEVEVKL